MSEHRLSRRLMPRILALCAAAAAGIAHGSEHEGETILRNVEARLAGVHDYTVALDVVADIERLNVPPMHVTMYFKQPDRIHLDAEGFALLPREGLQPDVGKLLSRYAITAVGNDTTGGISLKWVALQAKSERIFPRSLTVYVDPARWTTERIVTTGTADRVVTISFNYIQVEGFWLPGQMKAVFTLTPPDSLQNEPPPMPVRPQQKPRNGTLTVRYSDYRLNTGLSDEIFSKDAPPR